MAEKSFELDPPHRDLTPEETEEAEAAEFVTENECSAEGPLGYVCTRRMGHEGIHVAQGTEKAIYEVFTKDEETLPGFQP